ncbi:hypothetical protein TNCV_1477171 [Trichonephila clavipes]|nr:hypothetical protein TNCV_1477171 [Trichonephila clavipes]
MDSSIENAAFEKKEIDEDGNPSEASKFSRKKQVLNDWEIKANALVVLLAGGWESLTKTLHDNGRLTGKRHICHFRRVLRVCCRKESATFLPTVIRHFDFVLLAVGPSTQRLNYEYVFLVFILLYGNATGKFAKAFDGEVAALQIDLAQLHCHLNSVTRAAVFFDPKAVIFVMNSNCTRTSFNILDCKNCCRVCMNALRNSSCSRSLAEKGVSIQQATGKAVHFTSVKSFIKKKMNDFNSLQLHREIFQ